MARPASLKGFTLIELLIVIVIIGILSAGAVALFNGAQARARDAKRQSDVKTVETAIQLYASEHDGNVPVPGAHAILNGPYVEGDAPATGLIGKYLQKAVVGARAAESYCYYVNAADTSQYAIATGLENAQGANSYTVAGNSVTFDPAATDITDFAGVATACPTPVEAGWTGFRMGA